MTDSDTFHLPPEAEERPVRIFNSFVLANDAYHCRPEHLWPTEINGARPEWLEPMQRYLAVFSKPIRTIADEIKCVACDEQVTGHHVGTQDHRYRNKLSYSPEGEMEGRCTSCGYPCRLKHEIRMPNGQILVRLVGFPLFYHPSATQRTN